MFLCHCSRDSSNTNISDVQHAGPTGTASPTLANPTITRHKRKKRNDTVSLFPHSERTQTQPSRLDNELFRVEPTQIMDLLAREYQCLSRKGTVWGTNKVISSNTTREQVRFGISCTASGHTSIAHPFRGEKVSPIST